MAASKPSIGYQQVLQQEFKPQQEPSSPSQVGLEVNGLYWSTAPAPALFNSISSACPDYTPQPANGELSNWYSPFGLALVDQSAHFYSHQQQMTGQITQARTDSAAFMNIKELQDAVTEYISDTVSQPSQRIPAEKYRLIVRKILASSLDENLKALSKEAILSAYMSSQKSHNTNVLLSGLFRAQFTLQQLIQNYNITYRIYQQSNAQKVHKLLMQQWTEIESQYEQLLIMT
ncbi:hypothetical protein D5018_13215 [Parashewanella curva]|uniref:Uncharacterized protein n=1 Tax=Parashewanella curva TaxID=2338552 RepID=A0A3L8PV03_9GAMM|nr:hypothetical protein [Parashewanella curva]RLV59235.1 hypothetical protein D5018_13215 [Parashewanella curva]